MPVGTENLADVSSEDALNGNKHYHFFNSEVKANTPDGDIIHPVNVNRPELSTSNGGMQH